MTININEVLVQRGKTHGDFAKSSRVSQTLKDVCYKADGYGRLSASQREALDMVLHKIARILYGNPHDPDHWVDIQGYARLISQELEDNTTEGVK